MPDTPDPCIVVIFGASGDLTSRKLIPALYEMHLEGQLPLQTCVLGNSRTAFSDEAWRDALTGDVQTHAKSFDSTSWRAFSQRIFYESGSATESGDMKRLGKRIESLCAEKNCPANLLFYLSVKPSLYEPIIRSIDAAGLVTEGRRWCAIDRDRASWQRIIIEKPFGRDLESAQALNRTLGRVFEEEAIFRIDHYLGKELVQNVLVFRFANAMFEPIWNHRYVDHVQISAAESLGVGERASFYDEAGAVRDMIQSHLMQVMALVAMEPPTRFESHYIRSEKIKIIDAIQPLRADELAQCAVLGQFAAGPGTPAYHELEGVPDDSTTETFAAVMFHFDNWRWAGTPFYLRTGKRMAQKCTEVVIELKRPAANLFRHVAEKVSDTFFAPNRISIEIAPDPGVSIRFEGKVPGSGMRIASARMHFDYAERFGSKPVEAYGPLILDAMRGDQTLFPHRHEVEAGWRAVTPLIGSESSAIRSNIRANYAPGSWGPEVANAMLARHGREWRNGGKRPKR